MATEYTVEGQQLLRHHIPSVALKVGITKQIGWHTFRRTYCTLLRATGAELISPYVLAAINCDD